VIEAIPLCMLLRSPRGAAHAPGEARSRESPLATAHALLSNPSFLLLLAYFTLPAIAGWVVRDWMQRTDRGRIYVSAIGMAAIVPALLGWGRFDTNNMPILSQIVRPEQRAAGYGIMNFASISFGGLADVGYGWFRDQQVPLPLIFGGFAALACLSAWLVLCVRPVVPPE
jgi:hypothetical protein